MLRRSFVLIAGFVCIVAAQGNPAAFAQDESRTERFFRYLDRDSNGRIDGEELRRLDGRMRDRLREAGLNPDRDIAKDSFVKAMEQAEEERRRGDDRGSSSSRSRGPEKVQVVIPLPSQYTAFDKNGDNQIGLYEWDRAKFLEFLQLDRNGDGFLTPRELDDPPKPAVTAATPTAPTTTRPGSAPVAGSVGQPTASPATSSVEETPETRRAKYFFSITDKDKNGEISAEEWSQSRGVRGMFERAQISPPMPLKEAVFVEQFLAVQKQNAS